MTGSLSEVADGAAIGVVLMSPRWPGSAGPNLRDVDFE